ncbi:MAG: zinc ribbon domain-containing protein [Clostridia bacterium]|nr:zinc ribbon domain-containing protein [Clostridia bacterium]
MICDRCGAHIADNAEYCPRCGTVYGAAGQEKPPRYAPGVPGVARVRVVRPESVGTYFLWWTVALFSNAEIVCFVLSVVFAFSSGNKNRANFFRAVLLFKLFFLAAGLIVVIVLAFAGFSFTDLLNRLDFDLIRDYFSEVI